MCNVRNAHFVLHATSVMIVKELMIFFKAIDFVLVVGFGF